MRSRLFLQWIRPLGVVAAVALILSLSALWNGQPLFHPDTPTYLRGAEMGAARLLGPAALKSWLPVRATDKPPFKSASASDESPKRLKPLTSLEDKLVLSGRSVYYGALLYAGYLGGMWPAVAFQALSVAYVLQLLMARLWGLRSSQVVGVAAALSLLTPLGVYTGFLMPDVFAPLVILCIAVLAVYWRQLHRIHRWLLSALLLFSVSVHASHLALALCLLVLALAARWLSARWRGLSWAGLAMVAACIAGGLGAEWAFNKTVTAAVGAPPLHLPHSAARLIDLGPGTDFLKQHCPESAYAVCAYVRNYPTSWEDFLFSRNPAKGTFALADAATKRRMADEQFRFVLDVLRFDPVGVVAGEAGGVLQQLGQFRVDIWGYSKRVLALYEGRVPDSVFADMRSSRAARFPVFNHWVTISSYALVLASVLLAGLWWSQRAGSTAAAPARLQQRRFADFSAIVVAGVIANAVVCATLASSLDRFQSRVIWLLPFLTLVVLVRASVQSASPVDATAGARCACLHRADSSWQRGRP